MSIVARVDEMGKPAWLGLLALSFFTCAPVGIALLVFLIGSGRMGCWKNGRRGQWGGPWSGSGRWESRDGFRDAASRWYQRAADTAPSSGNRAFDEYRAETLRRLEEEQKDFHAFLDRLRFAKDKAEFDEFLNQRRNTPPQTPPQTPGEHPQTA